MRCDECQTEPLTPGHYCECCGRKLSLQERKALTALENSTASPAPFDSASAPAPFAHTAHFSPLTVVPEAPDAKHPLLDPRLDPILEAHFAAAAAAHAPVEPVFVSPVAPVSPPRQPVSVAPVTSLPPSPRCSTLVSRRSSRHTLPAARRWSCRGKSPHWRTGRSPFQHFTEVATAPAESEFDEVPSSFVDADAPPARCEICSGAVDDENVCAACQRAFNSILDSDAFLTSSAEAHAARDESASRASMAVAPALPFTLSAPQVVAVEPPGCRCRLSRLLL